MDHLNVTTEILDLAEARARIPKVAPLVATVMETSRAMRRIHARISEAPDAVPEEERDELQERFAGLETRFRAALKEMNGLGAYLKDPDTGLLDFYSWKDGEMVFLCWRHGEDTIRHWHGLDEGFAGRKPIGD